MNHAPPPDIEVRLRTHRFPATFRSALAATLALAACASEPEQAPAPNPAEATAKKAITTEKLEPYQCGTIQRLHTYAGIFLASQPAAEDFAHAKEGGVKTVLNVRKPDELKDFDEAKVVRELGLAYYEAPFNSPAELTDQVYDQIRVLLNDPSKRPILFHCSSGNRVGAAWLVHRVLDGRLSFDAALEEARTVGLKLPAYETRAREYIAQRQQTK